MKIKGVISSVQLSSVAQSCPTLRPHESQHTRPPCPSPTPGVNPEKPHFRANFIHTFYNSCDFVFFFNIVFLRI